MKVRVVLLALLPVVVVLIAAVPLLQAQSGPVVGFESQVWVVGSNGQELRQLTGGGDRRSHPTWSPNGRQLAVGAHGDPGSRIEVIDVANARVRRLARSRLLGGPGLPAWSPTRDEILFEAGYGDDDHPRTAIAVIRLDGSRPRRLVSFPSWRYPLGGPEWSPDGTRIAYIREHRKRIRPHADPLQPIALGGPLDIAVIGRRGGGRWTARLRGDEHLPSWSPDGRWIAFVRSINGGRRFGVWKVSSSGRRAQRLGPRLVIAAPAWSRDSRQIAFSGVTIEGDRHQHLYVMDARHGAVPRKLVPEVGPAPAWSPAADLIAFADFEGRVRVTAPDGGGQRTLATFPADTEFRDLAWSPDGTQLAFTAEKQPPSD